MTDPATGDVALRLIVACDGIIEEHRDTTDRHLRHLVEDARELRDMLLARLRELGHKNESR